MAKDKAGMTPAPRKNTPKKPATAKKVAGKAAPARRKVGAPSMYSEELAQEICRHIADSVSLRAIAAMEGMPAVATIMSWLADDSKPEFMQQYIRAREAQLLAHLTEELQRIEGLRIFGTAPDKAAVVSFLIDGAHAHDLATLLDLEGVAVRSGQHCAHPLLQSYGVAATCRASLAFYNTHDEIEQFISALKKARNLLA